MSEKHTVILGGGFGGIAAALKLRALLPSGHRITLIDRDEHFVVGAAQAWVMLGKETPDAVRAPRRDLVARGIDLVVDRVVSIEPEHRAVQTTKARFEADFLVVALGAELNPSAIPGLSAAHHFYSLEGATQLKEALATFSRGHVVLLIPRTPFKCPPVPYEAAIVLDQDLSARGHRKDVRISLFTVEPAPMPSAGTMLGEFLRERLAAANVAFHPSHKTTSVDPERRRVEFEGKAGVDYDLLIAVPPHEAPKVVVASGLCKEGGWIPVDRSTLKTRFDNVWAIGDVCAVSLPGKYKPEDPPLMLPKAGVFAESQGVVVAAQIAALSAGNTPSETFAGKGACYIETGAGNAFRGDGDFFALPHPLVAPSGEANAATFEEKKAWVRSHLRFDQPK